jgi:Polysaccharide lyase
MKFTAYPQLGLAVCVLMGAVQVPSNELGSANFDDGTFGPFTVQPAGTVRIVDDPAKSGRGKVAEMSFRSDSMTPHPRAALALMPPSQKFGLGSTIYFSGDVFIPATTFNLRNPSVRRTLLAFRAPLDVSPHDSTDSFVMLEHTGSCELRVEWSQDGWWRGSDCRLAPFEPDRWHKVEMRVTMNSAPDKADGTLELWVNGKSAFRDSTVRLTNAARAGKPSWQSLQVGVARYKAEVRGGFDLSEGDAIREVRYWDNVTFGTIRR